MKKALVCDILLQNGGAEKCVESFLNVWPEMDVFALMDHMNSNDRDTVLKGKFAETTFLQNLPFSKKLFRHFFPMYPFAVEQIDLSEYDVILSSSYSVAKGVITRPDQTHITYMYSPVRYVWDLYFQYLAESGKNKGIMSYPTRYLLHQFRSWDAITANRPDHYIAISNYIAQRIKKIYNKESHVIYPPVDCHNYTIGDSTEDYYFTSSRMVPYKKMDLIVEAFKYMPDKKLFVSGDGPDFDKIKKIAGKNVELLGFLPKNELILYTQKAKAFIFAAEEDFGITPIEAQACGVPVIAFGKGGALETIKGVFPEKELLDKEKTGVFFEKQEVHSLIEAIRFFEKNREVFDKNIIRNQALKFNTQRFEKEMFDKVNELMNVR